MNKKILILSLIFTISLAFIGCEEPNKADTETSKELKTGKPSQKNTELAQKFFEEGNYKQALAHDLKQLEEDLNYYKEQSAEISLDYNNIGLDYDEQENYHKALEYIKKQ